MDKEAIQNIILELQRRRGELEGVEVKAAATGTPPDLFKPFSAFANLSGGGILLFGLDEDSGFKVVGVGNPRKLQEDLSGIAAQMVPPLRPNFSVEDIEGGTVVAVEIPEVPYGQKPCYHAPHHLQNGSFIRVGNSTRRMSDYEIFGFISSRTQPKYDEEAILDATLEDLDRTKLEEYLAQKKRTRPTASYWSLPFEQVLRQLSIVSEVNGILRPTLAGLLMFGIYPQSFESQLVITFLHYYGMTTEESPTGARFLDNRKFEGTISEMIETAISYILANMSKSSFVRGVYRRDLSEYPEIALREAIANAVAHRDYSNFVRGSHIQIRRFADRLEVENPGGLYGGVTVDRLQEGQSTRNRLLMQLMEDVHLVENRGSGIDTILEAIRKANLKPPLFEDKASSFWVTLYNTSLTISEEEDRILAYVLEHGSIRRSESQQLLGFSPKKAKSILLKMRDAGLLAQKGTRKGAHYILRQKQITMFKIGNLWVFKQFFDDKETFKALLDYYNNDQYRFEFKSIGERNIALKLLEQNGFDYDLREDLRGYVVKLPRFAKYAQVLKNSVAYKETANDRLFLMKDLAAVEEAVSLGAQIVKEDLGF